MLLRPFAHTLAAMIQVMYGLPVMDNRSQSAGPSRSSPSASGPSSGPSGSSAGPDPGMPPPPGAGASQGTVTLTTEQWTATQAVIARVATLEATVTQLNNQVSQPQPSSDFGLRSNLKPKMPDVYTGKSHKERHEFLRQCTEHIEALNCKVDSPASIAFAASLLRGDTTGPMWTDYRSSLAPGHVVTWAEFKKVLRDDLGDEDAFVDATWGKFFSYHQRAHESVRSFTVTLHQLRSILQEYDPLSSPTESMMIRRLRSALRPEICAALYNTGERVESYSVFLKKVMSAETSANLQTSAKTHNKRERSRDASPSPSSNKERPNKR